MVSNNQINNIIFHLFYQTKWTYFQNVWQQIHTHSFPWWYQTKKNKRFHIMEWIRFVSLVKTGGQSSCLSKQLLWKNRFHYCTQILSTFVFSRSISQTQNSLLSITCKNSFSEDNKFQKVWQQFPTLEQTVSHHRTNSFRFMSMDNHLGYQSIFCQKSFSSE